MKGRCPRLNGFSITSAIIKLCFGVRNFLPKLILRSWTFGQQRCVGLVISYLSIDTLDSGRERIKIECIELRALGAPFFELFWSIFSNSARSVITFTTYYPIGQYLILLLVALYDLFMSILLILGLVYVFQPFVLVGRFRFWHWLCAFVCENWYKLLCWLSFCE